MSGMSQTAHPWLAVLLITAGLFCATTALGTEYAKIGHVYPDGTVELDMSRLVQTLSTGPQTTEAVGQTALSISNGLLKLYRIGQNQCPYETVYLYGGGYPIEEFFPLTAAVADGKYPNGTRFSDLNYTGSVYVTIDRLGPLLYDCVDNGCSNRWGTCLYDSRDNCGCFTADEPGNGQFSPSGCKEQIAFRSWWSLADLVRPEFIQNL